ncbi:Radial spoke head protein 4 A [Cladochytrium tenue]|nr:Radial spoke head protein 4 A [Cladochytrium tenue]
MFELISAEVKKQAFDIEGYGLPGSYKVVHDPIPGLELAKAQAKLLEPVIPEEERAEGDGETPDIMDLSNLWEWAGLVRDRPLKSVRVWGKVLGLQKSYLVAEAELKDGQEDEEPAAGEQPSGGADGAGAGGEGDREAAEKGDSGDGEGGGASEEGGQTGGVSAENDPTLPKPKVKVTAPLSREVRSGTNKYVYYVCTEPGGKWFRLPDVVPEKLQVARKIRKYFVGDLNRQIISYPAFNGTEAEYLRCQISRISAATVASPAGYYTFDPQDGDGDEEDHQPTIVVNSEFEGTSNTALLSAEGWVHHVPYILPQGRVTWENPSAGGGGGGGGDGDDDGGEGSDGAGEGDGEEAEAPEPETGPPLLTPLSADEEVGDGPAWVSRACSMFGPSKFSPVVLRSTRWPGAVLVAYNDRFASIYIGDGHREVGSGGSGLQVPPGLGAVMGEYVIPRGDEGEGDEGVDDEDADKGGLDGEDGEQLRKQAGEGEAEDDAAAAAAAGDGTTRRRGRQERDFVEQRDPTVEEEAAYEEAQRAKAEEEAGEEGEEGEDGDGGGGGGGEDDEEE